jgi:hypothetical protein
MSVTQTFVIIEGEREVSTVAGLTGAAMVWNENPGARRVYQIAPTGPVGPDAWERVREVMPDELNNALHIRV